MTNRADILKELASISPVLAQISPENPYQAPVGYFDDLCNQINGRIAAGGIEELSLVELAGKQMPNDVPEGYFDQLSNQILTKIKSEQVADTTAELFTLSPVLAKLDRSNLYEVPAGYFEQLPHQLSEQIKPAKVVSMFSKSSWIRYAAAAVVFGLIAFGIQFIMQETSSTSPVAKTDEQISKELAQISDEEIINYLKQTADSKDVEAIAAVVDQSQLPSEIDYMDDAFMESFMKELEQTDNKSN